MTTSFKPSTKQKIVLLGYSLLWLLIIPFALCHFFYQLIRRKPGYTKARLSRYGFTLKQGNQKDSILIHCASVGEVVAIQNLVEQLLGNNPKQRITITTNTTTGADRVRLLFSDRVEHAYLPYDFPFFLRFFLKRKCPTKVLINEMELWPNLCDQCWRLNIPIFIINGRMSEKSTKTYQKNPSLFQPMFEKITAICAQDQRDYQNYLTLGVSPDKLILTNNIKFDLSISDHDIALSQTIKTNFALEARLIIVAGSTHEPEEQILLDAYLALVTLYPALLLIIVPRHPQRFEKVHQLLQTQNIETSLMSDAKPCTSMTQVLLCDQMGKLRSIYALADISFVGGSLADRGGHNALEPAAMAVPILMGESTYNNPAICQALTDSGALLTVTDARQIETACKKWLDNPEQRKHAGNAGKQVLALNRGAIQKTLDVLTAFHSP
ncbi:lipid IV(A) 3-deoxy-D-manno-octulosonic acid transferase [Paraglaciecola sp. MB-3u-78]|uniref:lipid IV(A) 3-deoxy-D-manno-octulosonic acid transferase n=1 Tax=Paraglaciecola sp. MB-3u-78 TaxID=2058332 RepID=UPI000C3403BB|nr:lipid IV(A) 3-deoxy-D-manno-octulosonic acid transferase [Paraglaciecola sp. MB-3u-78]PKG97830.1 3-deoxy-D-manno-octulosonic acid transferase [Paraglaciecola sp. MB-3u-78]